MTDERRRNFLVKTLAGMGCAFLTSFLLPGIRNTVFSRRGEGDWKAVGDVETMGTDRPTLVQLTRTTGRKTSVWIVRPAQGPVIAFGPKCTHLGCAYSWDDEQADFECPCHGSRFAIDGSVKEGPATRPLDRYPTRTEGRELLIQIDGAGD